ncbi:hypothetical protein BH24ACT5_BH24ACT5_20880 [soil metagenome]
MALYCTLDTVDGVAMLTLTGDLDLATAPELQNAITRLLDTHRDERVAIDLDGVDALDDVGLGLVLGAAGRARQQGGDVVVVCAPGTRRDRLALTGFDRAVTVVGRLADLAHPADPA